MAKKQYTNDVDKEGLTAMEVASGYRKETVCEVLEKVEEVDIEYTFTRRD